MRPMRGGVPRTMFALGRGGNIPAVSGNVARRMPEFFHSLGEAGNFRSVLFRIMKVAGSVDVYRDMP